MSFVLTGGSDSAWASGPAQEAFSGRVESQTATLQPSVGTATSWSADQLLGLEDRATFAQASSAQASLPADNAADKDAQTLGLLFAGNADLSGRNLDKVATEIRITSEAASPTSDCTSQADCPIATASTIPGSVWLVAAALIGLLGVGTRRPRTQAA